MRTFIEPLESRSLLAGNAATLIGVASIDQSNVLNASAELLRAGTTTVSANVSTSSFIGVSPSPVYNPARFDNAGVVQITTPSTPIEARTSTDLGVGANRDTTGTSLRTQAILRTDFAAGDDPNIL